MYEYIVINRTILQLKLIPDLSLTANVVFKTAPDGMGGLDRSFLIIVVNRGCQDYPARKLKY
jgi:hypothetical protein